MKVPVRIGERDFSSKKDALLHYKTILNSHEFGDSLYDNDFEDLVALLNYEHQISLIQLAESENLNKTITELSDDRKPESDTGDSAEIFVENIIISKVQFNTKCFEVVYSDGTSCYISYLMLLNRQGYTPEKLFTTACRNCIQGDLMKVKHTYFKANSIKGRVKCQETNILSSWEELAVDHRQPNTLSVIIDRFREINIIDINTLEYRTTSDNLIIFKDQGLTQRFILYHGSKATLRIVRKECNSSRSAMGRIKKNSKDLIINQTQLPLF